MLDGPVDTLWIENLNTVLDDNKMLCLSNGQRMKLPQTIQFLFEVENLLHASPATVSRCGMVYLDIQQLSWRPYANSWLRNFKIQKLNIPKNQLELFKSPVTNAVGTSVKRLVSLFSDNDAILKKDCRAIIECCDVN